MNESNITCLNKLTQSFNVLQRGVEVERHFDKYKLIDLFYKYVLPLPQRKHRPNRKGLLLAQSQQLLDKLKLVPPTTTNKLMKNHAVKRSEPFR